MSTEEKDYNVTTNEIMDYLKENMVTREEFSELKENMVTREEFSELKGNMVTREVFNTGLGKFRSDMIDYLDKRLMDLKADIVLIMRGEDRKLLALVDILVAKNVITDTDAQKLMKMEPFPQRV